MAFIILGSVGSALASGLAAVGLGTVGAAGAAGTGIAGAVGTAAGAASGIGSGIAGGIASGLGALGMGTAAAPSALASAIGTGATTAAGGAGMGAASSAAMGGDPGQGALMGGLTAGAMSGIGGLMGGASGSAGSAVGDGLTTASEAMLNPTAAAAAPGATTVGDVATQTAMGQTGAAIPELATQAAAPTSSLFGGFGGDLTEMAVKEGMGMMKPEEGQVRVPRSGGGGRPKSRYDEEQEQGMGNPFANPFAGFAEGGLTTLKGGGISMREGQYVVPADVVSAIGNGSSKAGAKFLEQAFNHYIQNGPPEGVQPQKRAGSLAEQRMQERVQREAA